MRSKIKIVEQEQGLEASDGVYKHVTSKPKNTNGDEQRFVLIFLSLRRKGLNLYI